jgi:hypothetical protein
LRVRGRLGVSRTVYFGVHLRDASGAFAGRFLTARSPHEFGAGEVFDVTLPIRDFILDPSLKHLSKKLPARPFELTVESVFCHTLTHPAGLELFQIEVIPPAVP